MLRKIRAARRRPVGERDRQRHELEAIVREQMEAVFREQRRELESTMRSEAERVLAAVGTVRTTVHKTARAGRRDLGVAAQSDAARDSAQFAQEHMPTVPVFTDPRATLGPGVRRALRHDAAEDRQTP